MSAVRHDGSIVGDDTHQSCLHLAPYCLWCVVVSVSAGGLSLAIAIHSPLMTSSELDIGSWLTGSSAAPALVALPLSVITKLETHRGTSSSIEGQRGLQHSSKCLTLM